MKRVLTFDGPRAPKRFQLLWTALISGGGSNGDGKDRTPVVIRKEARLQDALEAISNEVASNGNEADRALKVEAGPLTISQEDFDLLQQYAEKTPWTPRVSRDVVDLWDWLSTADKRE